MMLDIPAFEYDRAREQFRRFDKGGNFFFPIRTVAIAFIGCVVVFLVFQKWWILIPAALCLLDLTKKAGFKEGYIHGFEYGFERNHWKTMGVDWPDEEPMNL